MNQKITPLCKIADLIMEQMLARLGQAAAQRQETLALIAALDAPPPDGPADVAMAKVDLLYQRWADQRRTDLNSLLARQTAEWLTLQAEARLAFGRSRALQKLNSAVPQRR